MNWKKHVLEGNPFDDLFIFDVHGHIGAHKRLDLLDSDADDLIASMDRLGIDVIAVSSFLSFTGDWVAGNQITEQAAKRFPGRVLGYASPDPFDEECNLSPYFETDRGFCGIKIHGLEQGGTPMNDRRYFPAYELANRLELPVLFHAWLPHEVAQVADVARQFPHAIIIMGHAGLTAFASKEEAISACKKYDNVYLDTAISETYDGSLEYIVSKVGADRILYGSDLGTFECTQTLGKLALSKLTDTEKEKILGINARNLFKL